MLWLHQRDASSTQSLYSADVVSVSEGETKTLQICQIFQSNVKKDATVYLTPNKPACVCLKLGNSIIQQALKLIIMYS